MSSGADLSLIVEGLGVFVYCITTSRLNAYSVSRCHHVEVHTRSLGFMPRLITLVRKSIPTPTLYISSALEILGRTVTSLPTRSLFRYQRGRFSSLELTDAIPTLGFFTL